MKFDNRRLFALSLFFLLIPIRIFKCLWFDRQEFFEWEICLGVWEELIDRWDCLIVELKSTTKLCKSWLKPQTVPICVVASHITSNFPTLFLLQIFILWVSSSISLVCLFKIQKVVWTEKPFFTIYCVCVFQFAKKNMITNLGHIKKGWVKLSILQLDNWTDFCPHIFNTHTSSFS